MIKGRVNILEVPVDDPMVMSYFTLDKMELSINEAHQSLIAITR